MSLAQVNFSLAQVDFSLAQVNFILDADQSPLLAKALLDKCDELKTVGGDQGVASDQDVITFLDFFGFRSTEYDGDNNSKT
jgi:hypothetical protein